MKLKAVSSIRFATGRNEFTAWNKDGSVRARNLVREVNPGEFFDLPDIEARALIKSGSAIRAETYGEEP